MTMADDLQIEVADFLGIGRDASTWSTNEAARLESIVKYSVDQFMTPESLPNEAIPHVWSFLRPIETLDTVATYDDGTVSITQGSATVTIGGGGSWPSWTAEHGSITIDDVEYAIDSVDGNDVTLSESYAGTTDAAAEYELEHDGNYDLPATIAAVDGAFYFDSNSSGGKIDICAPSRILERRQNSRTAGTPTLAALQFKEPTSEGGQRNSVMFYPIPNTAWTLSYHGIILPHLLTLDQMVNLCYHHFQVVLASCLAIAEQRFYKDSGSTSEQAHYVRRLEAAVKQDRMTNRVHYYGPCTQHSEFEKEQGVRNTRDRNTNAGVTYNGG